MTVLHQRISAAGVARVNVSGRYSGEWRNGRRAGFRCQCPSGRGGSSPPSPTTSSWSLIRSLAKPAERPVFVHLWGCRARLRVFGVACGTWTGVSRGRARSSDIISIFTLLKPRSRGINSLSAECAVAVVSSPLIARGPLALTRNDVGSWVKRHRRCGPEQLERVCAGPGSATSTWAPPATLQSPAGATACLPTAIYLCPLVAEIKLEC